MSLLLLSAMAAAAAAPATLPQCSWDRPGHNPFVGDVVAAVDRYKDIPPEVRAKLQQRMRDRQYDELVLITRNRIAGQYNYAPTIRDMHFGAGQVCGKVTRARWSATTQERGMVYCETGHCVMVPTVCRNVSRVTRLPGRGATAAQGPADKVAVGPGSAGVPGHSLAFDPPGAGNLAPGATPGNSSFAALAPLGAAGVAGAAPAALGAPGGASAGEPGGPGSDTPLATSAGGAPASPAAGEGSGTPGGGSAGGSGGGGPGGYFSSGDPVFITSPAAPGSGGSSGGGGGTGGDNGGGTSGGGTIPGTDTGAPVITPGATFPGSDAGAPVGGGSGGNSGGGVTPAVPEPQTYALMLLGLAGVILAARRRRR